MRTIVAGSRDFRDFDVLDEALTNVPWEITVVVSGMAQGADLLGEEWAMTQDIPIERYPAEWSKYGRGAGPVRNRQMADNAEALVAFWDGESRGTKSMIRIATHLGLKVLVVHV